MSAEYRCGAFLVDLAFYRAVDRVGFGLCGNDTENAFGCNESGDGKGKCVLGHVGKLLEATVVYLLHTAGLVKRNYLDHLFIVEIGNVGVVKGDVAVFADAHNDDIAFIGCEKRRITLAFCFGVDCGAVDIIYRRKGNATENGIF